MHQDRIASSDAISFHIPPYFMLKLNLVLHCVSSYKRLYTVYNWVKLYSLAYCIMLIILLQAVT